MKWLPIPNLKPYYASDTGKIAKWIPDKEMLIMFTRIKKGYAKTMLTTPNGRKDFLVHRLIAMAWIGLPEGDKNEINHKDGDKLNNVPSNLEWVTRSENSVHYYNILDGKEKCPKVERVWTSKFTRDEVRLIRRLRSEGKWAKEISEILGKNVTPTNVCNITSGRTYKSVD